MSITRRGCSWQVSVTHEGRRVRKSFKSHDSARHFEMQCSADLMAGKDPLPKKSKDGLPATLGGLADHVWDLEWSRQKSSDRTFNRMLSVREHFGDATPVASITPYMLESYIIHLRSVGNGPATINRKMAIMSKIMGYAHRHGVVSVKPIPPKQREPEGRLKYYSKDEEKRMLAAMDDYDLKDFFIILIDTGFRKSEALSLRWCDMEDASLILSDPEKIKTSKPRSVPMTRRVRKVLLERMHATVVVGDKLVLPRSLIFRFSSRRLDYLAKKFKEEYKVLHNEETPALFHTCRHTFCSRLIQRGIPLTTVKELAGHSDINTTLRYSHLAPSNFSDAILKLEESE